MPTPFESYVSATLASLQEEKQLRQLRPLMFTPEGRIRLTESSAEYFNLNSNNYLGLPHLLEEGIPHEVADLDPRKRLLSGSDWGSTSSRLLVGDRELYHRLEEEIAQSLQHEAALLFNSGYHANVGMIAALGTPRSCVVIDKLAHASMIDGVRLSRLPYFRFRHNDMQHLEDTLRQKSQEYDTIFVMVESLYSMDGDFAPLHSLVQLKRQFPQVVLYVDEAHAIGVYGAHGYGWAEVTDTLTSIDLLIGTFGKALGGMGAYVACSAEVRELLINRSRSLIFSTMLPLVQLYWNRFAWNLLPYLGTARQRLAESASHLRKVLVESGESPLSESHIVPVICGSSERAYRLCDHLLAGGVYALPVRHPTVPRGTERVRLSLTADLTHGEVERLCLLLQSFLCNKD